MKSDERRKSASARARRGLQSLRRSKNMCNDHSESDRHEERRASQERERESASKILNSEPRICMPRRRRGGATGASADQPTDRVALRGTLRASYRLARRAPQPTRIRAEPSSAGPRREPDQNETMLKPRVMRELGCVRGRNFSKMSIP
jgi:hypothetical protein